MKRYHKFNISIDILVALFISAALFYIVYRIKMRLHYHWEWNVIPQYLFYHDPQKGKWVANLLIQGLFTTIRLSIWSTLLAVIIGTVMGLCRISSSLFNRLLARTYIELIRNLPPLVLIFIFYYFIGNQILPIIGVDTFVRNLSKNAQTCMTLLFAPPSLFSEFLSALITLAVFEGAYIAEIVRAGIQSIEKGQWEAACACGLSSRQQVCYIIMPQAIKRILPPLAGQFISTIKDSAIVSVISIQELTFQAMELMSATYLTFEVWITVTGLYLLLTLSCSLAVGRWEIFMRKNEA